MIKAGNSKGAWETRRVTPKANRHFIEGGTERGSTASGVGTVFEDFSRFLVVYGRSSVGYFSKTIEC
jgi:hypothetical protein